MKLQLAADHAPSELLALDWDRPLRAWTGPHMVRMARGPSRHLVRFVELDGAVFAVKEIGDELAEREYRLLRAMEGGGIPVVDAAATVCARRSRAGEPLEGVVVTRYLAFALPYTYLLGQEQSARQQHRLVDAAAVLLVTLHLDGFFWGDCSLANMLFRRDAGALAAHLVDAETAEHHPSLSPGQRALDVEIAVDNAVGGVADLVAAGRLGSGTDPVEFGLRLESRYEDLWAELTGEEELAADEAWRVEERIRRLERLGFDAVELDVRGDDGRPGLRLRPTVVEEGHHARRLASLTGIQAEEGQARRLLEDVDRFRRSRAGTGRLPEALLAHRWLTERYEPFVASIPVSLAARLEPAEAYHQLLEHRWYLSEAAGEPVDDDVAVASYLGSVLPALPEERVVLPDITTEVPVVRPSGAPGSCP